jgi:molybdopterin molybdotransferase
VKPPLSLEEAQAQLLALLTPLPIEHRAAAEAQGYYLAAPLVAQRTQPAADLSAMDGYAVRLEDLAGPWRVIGESAAGHPYAGTVGAGEAVRIATGALLPAGTGAVVLQEDVSRGGDAVTLTGTPPSPPDRYLRRRGLDYVEGAPLLDAGSRIGPAQIALGLTSGHAHLPVRQPPRLAVIEGGDELCPPGAPCPPHLLPASNGAMLAALAGHLPVTVDRAPPVPDRLEAMIAALHAADGADLIVTSGGASVGDHDLVQPALRAWGAEVNFWRIAIKPGKPLMVARKGRQVVIGLPGNPVSSFVTGFFFMLPALRVLLGAAQPCPAPIATFTAAALAAGGDRREFLRARWDGASALASPQTDSGALASLAQCNALIDRPAGAAPLPAGATIPAYLLGNGGIL